MKIALGIIFLTSFLFGQKVVYDLTTSDINRLQDRLISGIVAHTNHYNDNLQELEVKVIIHGGAYKFFMKDKNPTKEEIDLSKRLKSLVKQYDVKFYVCEVGIMQRKLNKKAFYPFISMVKNAAIGLIDAQNEGYAYLPLK
jgi:intracellular sulfur oxidation DsrE/DsrF family protein